MSVADRLGTGASFGGVPRGGRSARGRAKAVVQGEVPAYELMKLRLNDVSPTPLNPRRNFGTEEEQQRFGEELRQAQLAACVVVTRQAYLDLWPEHAPLIGEAGFVLVNGERRYRSGAAVGLESLDFVVRDDLAATREDFVDRLLKENLDREDFDVIERARGVQQMVDVCGGDSERGAKTRAAERLGRDRSWVTNQLALLTLPDELQAMLSCGELSERDGRAMARWLKDESEVTSSGLLEHLRSSKEQTEQERQREKAILHAARSEDSQSGGGLLSADNKPRGPLPEQLPRTEQDEPHHTPSSETTGQGPHRTPDNLLSADNKPASPEDVLDRDAADAMPWEDPGAFHDLLLRRMSREHRRALTKLLLDSNRP